MGITGSLGISRDLFHPLYGLLSGSAQAYVGQRGNRMDGGVRLFASVPAIFTHAGVDWNVALNRADLVLSAAFRPYAAAGSGAAASCAWTGCRGETTVWVLGTTVPIGQPFAGRTRPRHVDVRLPRPPPCTACRRSRRDPAEHTRTVLAGLREQLTARDSLLEGRNTYEREVAYYHHTLDRAFGLALGARAGETAAVGRGLADRAARSR